MLREKMLSLITNVNGQVCEREELIHHIAIALLTKKNLFILGDTGQAKSFAINEFRKRITGAKQFEKLMSKQADEEQLFGRLDLASIIPGNVSSQNLQEDDCYQKMYKGLVALTNAYQSNISDITMREQMNLMQEQISDYRKAFAELTGSTPQMITKGKIPDCHLIFLDEIFKSNEGILNSLLTALNERVWTNEGQTISIPVISFFSASNEIPNFNNPEERILKPLYDRFELKVLTRYVEDRTNRLNMLHQKQNTNKTQINFSIDLQELVLMQSEVADIPIPDSVNELMDDILCELRKKGIHISDRKYFNFAPIVQAQAWLDGHTEVKSIHLKLLKNYLWNTPEEILVIEDLLNRMCENPIGEMLNDIINAATESFSDFEQVAQGSSDGKSSKKALIKLRGEYIRLYDTIRQLDNSSIDNEASASSIVSSIDRLENLSKRAHTMANCTYAPLKELKELN